MGQYFLLMIKGFEIVFYVPNLCSFLFLSSRLLEERRFFAPKRRIQEGTRGNRFFNPNIGFPNLGQPSEGPHSKSAREWLTHKIVIANLFILNDNGSHLDSLRSISQDAHHEITIKQAAKHPQQGSSA